ncbi:MAG TPA: SRPBCC family protein [Candidatus Didemnitutus sp.]|jgi:hypothetical protein
MLVVLAGLFAGAVFLVTAIGFLLPARIKVARTLVIDLPPERIFPWVADLRLWPGWTVWNRSEDPTLSFSYPSATTGLAGSMLWVAARLGSGSLIITHFEQNRAIGYEMRLLSRAEMVQGRIALEPGESGATRVLWRDEVDLGLNPFRKLAGPLVARSLGKSFERNLAGLNAAALTGRAGGPG